MAIRYWILASRPKTLPAALSPVAIGTVLALKVTSIQYWVVALIVLTALLIQIGANFANDYFDFVKGIDAFRTHGPERMTQNQKISPLAMRNGFIIALGIAFVLGLCLVKLSGWPLLIVGILSIIFAIQYTGGPYPLGYIGLGELFVFIFFGPVAVGGTYYVLTGSLSVLAIVAGCSPGLISTGILIVNNLRDIDDDAKARKKTLAVRFGRLFSIWEYGIVMLAGTCLIPIIVNGITGWSNASFLPLLSVPLAIALITQVRQHSGEKLNSVLALTAQTLVLYSVLFVLGVLIAH